MVKVWNMFFSVRFLDFFSRAKMFIILQQILQRCKIVLQVKLPISQKRMIIRETRTNTVINLSNSEKVNTMLF